MSPMKFVFMLLVALAYSSISTAFPGSPQEEDVNDPIVQLLLASTLKQVKAPPKGTENELTTLVKVTKATSQVVSGIKYMYDFEARGVKTQKLYNCHIVLLSQPWAEGETVQDFQCQHLSSNFLERSNESSENEQLLTNENTFPGSPQQGDVNDPSVQLFLASTLTQVKAPPKGTDNELITLIKVTKVTFQVISGIKYIYDFEASGIKTHKVYTCSLTVISRPWAEGDVVEEYQCQHLSSKLLLRTLASANEQELNYYNRKDACTGCVQEKDVEDPLVQQFLESTLTHVKAPAKGTDNELTSLVKVTRVSTQVISGIKYMYDFEARGVKTHKLYNCHIIVLSRPWAEGETVQNFQCQHISRHLLQRSTRPFENEKLIGNENAFPGSPQEEDMNDPRVQLFLASILKQVKAPPKGTDNELTTLVKVTKVTFQVISGVKYRYDFEARGVKTHKLYNCSLTVVSRPWAEGDVVQDFQCQHHL